jgi:polyferredoxin
MGALPEADFFIFFTNFPLRRVFCCYNCFRAMLHFFWSVFMATVSASSVDVLSALERSMVVEGLDLRIAQLKRLVNAERDPVISDIRNKQLAAYSALVLKFR